jgi:sec-independent protein translocase protein TatC
MTHFNEFYWRVFYLFFAFFITSAVIYIHRQEVIFYIIQPLISISSDVSEKIIEEESEDFIFLNLTEALSILIYIATLTSFLFCIPLIWIQVWFFLGPGLYLTEQINFIRLASLSWCLLILGIFMSANFWIPQVWDFFLTFGEIDHYNDSTFHIQKSVPDGGVAFFEGQPVYLEEGSNKAVAYLPSISPYVHLFVEVVGVMILTSQIPLIGFLLIKWGWLVSREGQDKLLTEMRPWIVIGLLIWAACISPPDLFSQLILFIPLFCSYEIIVFWVIFKRIWQSK